MALEVLGETKGLGQAEKKALAKLYRRRIPPDELINLDLAREICELAGSLNRMIGLLVSRDGNIEVVVVGKKQILYLPDLGRYRLGQSRLRRLRLVFTDLSKSPQAKIPSDIYTDIEKLRLDAVVGLKAVGDRVTASYAYLIPSEDAGAANTSTEEVSDLGRFDLDFQDFMFNVEAELASQDAKRNWTGGNRAVLVGVYEKRKRDFEESMAELKELARSAGVEIVDSFIQRRDPDPTTLIGKGKLEELVLRCLRLDASHIIFDTELRPAQWRTIVNSTELKVLDRSMLILDIFAQRATTADGRLQVELAQLKYNLPRLTEQDSGLSRLSGGIGGRGPGETKLEISRRRARDKISDLEKRIKKLGEERERRRQKRREQELPLVAIVGYTNVGKSTLFNVLTKGHVLVENKLFATLDPTVRKAVFPSALEKEKLFTTLMSDTVGFIRDLPQELVSAFKATLEELHEATVLLHVLDASDPDLEQRRASVLKVIAELGLEDVPMIYCLNKCDKVNSEVLENLQANLDAVATSATKNIGIEKLRALIESSLR